jgi:hypothetical protein
MVAFVVLLDQDAATLVRLTEALAAKGVNITAFSLVPGTPAATIGFAVDKEEVARDALERAGIAAQEFATVQFALANDPGSLARVARALETAGVLIRLTLTLRASRGRAVDIVAVDDAERAVLVLRGLPAVTLVD